MTAFRKDSMIENHIHLANTWQDFLAYFSQLFNPVVHYNVTHANTYP